MSKDFSEDLENGNEEKIQNEKKKLGFFSHKRDSLQNKKGLLQKIGIQNLCILLVLGILLIYLCCQGDLKSQDKKDKNTKPADTVNTLDSNPIYTETEPETDEYVETLEKKLKDILAKVKGIGKVEVMITLSESKELVTLKDAPYTQDSVNENDGEGGSRISNSSTKEDKTVMSTTGNGGATPYIIKEIQPIIEGVLIIAEGGKDPVTELDIVEAVVALFNLPAHKIKIMEMGS